MGDRRLIIVYDFSLLVKTSTNKLNKSKKNNSKKESNNDVKDINGFLDHIPETSFIIFYCHGKVDSRKSLCKYLQKKKAIISFIQWEDYQDVNQIFL